MLHQLSSFYIMSWNTFFFEDPLLVPKVTLNSGKYHFLHLECGLQQPKFSSEFNKVITSSFDRRVLYKFIRQKVNNKAWFNEDCVNAFNNKQN